MTSSPDYKYNEGALIKELQSYIDNTYGEHYSQNSFQATEFIIDGGHGEGFCIGNILKYASRGLIHLSLTLSQEVSSSRQLYYK